MHLVVILGTIIMDKEEDLEDQVLEVGLVTKVQKDQEDLVMLEVSHHQKEMLVEVEETLTTEAVVPVEIIVSQSVLRMRGMVISKREHLLLLLKHLKVILAVLVDLAELRMVDKVVAVAALVVLAMVLLVQELVVMVVLVGIRMVKQAVQF